MPNWGGVGGSEGSLAKDQTFSGFSFVHPSLIYKHVCYVLCRNKSGYHRNVQILQYKTYNVPKYVISVCTNILLMG